jgi:hypothetical protein
MSILPSQNIPLLAWAGYFCPERTFMPDYTVSQSRGWQPEGGCVCKIWSPHSGITWDSCRMACDAALLGKQFSDVLSECSAIIVRGKQSEEVTPCHWSNSSWHFKVALCHHHGVTHSMKRMNRKCLSPPCLHVLSIHSFLCGYIKFQSLTCINSIRGLALKYVRRKQWVTVSLLF